LIGLLLFLIVRIYNYDITSWVCNSKWIWKCVSTLDL